MTESRKSTRTVPTEPVNMVDGIPDRSPSPRRWKYALLAGIFLAWLAFLIYCLVTGGVRPPG